MKPQSNAPVVTWDEAVERVWHALVEFEHMRICDLAAATNLRLDAVWLVIGDLSERHRVLVDPFNRGLVTFTGEADRGPHQTKRQGRAKRGTRTR